VEQWVASLSDWRTWRAIRPTSVRSVLELLDETSRDKVVKLQPSYGKLDKLHRAVKEDETPKDVYCYYTGDKSSQGLQPDDKWKQDEVDYAQILSGPSDGTVPLVLVTNRETDFIYTTNLDQVQDLLLQKDTKYHLQCRVGYVFTSPVEGTVPFYSLQLDDEDNKPKRHFYTISEAERSERLNRANKAQRFKDTGTLCYVYARDFSFPA
jgi:hypothetical protein